MLAARHLLINPFTQIERESWEPPEQLTCSQWADAYRVLGAQVAAVSGPYRTSRAEYCRGVMDALSDTAHREVWLQKPVQCGGSELGRNWIGWQSDVDPGPTLVVFPNEEACKETVNERIVPMFRDSPRLSRLMTGKPWDFKAKQVNLRTCSIYVGWSGSPQSLASRPIRRVLFDEVDKYAKWRGVESDPISLGKDRALTYRHRRKVFGLSTPTIPTGAIVKAVRACGDIRHYHINCEHCGGYDKPEFSKVSWEGREETDEDSLREQRARLEAKEIAVTYKCGLCEGLLTQAQIERGVKLGAWVTEGCEVGAHPDSETVGFVLSGICSPWIGIDRLAVEFCSAKLSGLAEMQNFYNAFLGEPFWDSEAMGDAMMQIDAKRLWEKSQAGHARGAVPEWAQLILCGADSKGLSGHQYVIRAFGAGYRSRLLEYGETDTSEELYDRVFRDWVDPTGRVLRCRRLCVDVGGGKGAGSRDQSRTDEIYRWCKTDPAHLWGVKGHGGTLPPARQVTTSVQTYHPPGGKKKSYEVTVSVVDTQYFKDLVASRVNSDDEELFEIYSVGRDYVLQMASERKILAERRIKGEEIRDIWRWVPRAAGVANHYFDCYDERTEVLTEDGFVLFSALERGARVATVNLASDEIEYQAPTALHAKRHDGDMVQIGGRPRQRVNLLVTPGHRMVVKAGQGATEWSVKKACDLTIWDKLKLRTGWSGREGWEHGVLGGSPEDFAEFLGWYVAEGHVFSYEHRSQPGSIKRRVVISQKRGGPWWPALERCLDALPWNWHQTEKSAVITNKSLHDYLKPLGNVYAKHVPKWVKQSPPNVIKAFIRGAVYGDGWECRGSQSYATVSPQLRDDMCELYLKAGYGVSVTTRPAGTWNIEGRSGTCVEQYHVHRRTSQGGCLRDGANKPNFSTVPYSGMVYCATVPNGTLIVRRGGKIAVCGNCEVYAAVAAYMLDMDKPRATKTVQPPSGYRPKEDSTHPKPRYRRAAPSKWRIGR